MGVLSIAPVRAQVVTQNIVGYVNLVLTNGYTFVANPLRRTNNTLTHIMAQLPEGSKVFVWDVTNQVYEPPAVFSSGIWSINYDLPPGQGFIVYTVSLWTNTFVGEVITGSSTNFVAGFNQFSLLGSKIPATGQLSGVLSFPLLEGSDVYLYRSISQEFSEAYSCFTNHGWFDPTGLADSDGPSVHVAESFLIQNPGPPANWVQILNPFASSPTETTVQAESSPVPLIQQISLTGNRVTLRVENKSGRRYNVQFSTDRLNWTTIARDQSRSVWSRDLPYSREGYFKLSTP